MPTPAPALTVGTDSYISLADAQSWATKHRLTAKAMINAVQDDLVSALLMACEAIDRLPEWQGVPSSMLQKLSWPRTSVYDRNGTMFPPDTIPDDIAHAQCEEALMLLRLAADESAADREIAQLQGITEQKLDTTTEKYGAPVDFDGVKSPKAVALIRPYLCLSVNGGVSILSPTPWPLDRVNPGRTLEGESW